MLAIAALIAYPFVFAQPAIVNVRPVQPVERERPLLDGLEKLIPQPLRAEAKGDVTVHIDMPPEARELMHDLHNDRRGIAIGGCVVIGALVLFVLILGAGVARYACDWRRK